MISPPVAMGDQSRTEAGLLAKFVAKFLAVKEGTKISRLSLDFF